MPSSISPEDVLIPKTRPSFVGTGLLSDSVIMLDKLATVEKSLIVRILGEVDNDLKAEMQRLTPNLQNAIGSEKSSP